MIPGRCLGWYEAGLWPVRVTPKASFIVTFSDLYTHGAGSFGSFALRIEGYFDGFSVLRAFDLIMDLAVLDTFHGFQTGADSEIFLRGGADCGWQFVVVNTYL